MKRFLLALAVAGLVWGLPGGVARANEFNETCSVTGGSAQKLSTVLTACGYADYTGLRELSLLNPDDAANDLYIGRSNVSASHGYKRSPGDSKTWRAAGDADQIQAGQIYLYVATTQNVMISLRSK
jgi:hypothetical protein